MQCVSRYDLDVSATVSGLHQYVRQSTNDIQVKSILDSLDDDPGDANVTKFAQMSMQHSTESDLDDQDDMHVTEMDQIVSKVLQLIQVFV